MLAGSESFGQADALARDSKKTAAGSRPPADDGDGGAARPDGPLGGAVNGVLAFFPTRLIGLHVRLLARQIRSTFFFGNWRVAQRQVLTPRGGVLILFSLF